MPAQAFLLLLTPESLKHFPMVGVDKGCSRQEILQFTGCQVSPNFPEVVCRLSGEYRKTQRLTLLTFYKVCTCHVQRLQGIRDPKQTWQSFLPVPFTRALWPRQARAGGHERWVGKEARAQRPQDSASESLNQRSEESKKLGEGRWVRKRKSGQGRNRALKNRLHFSEGYSLLSAVQFTVKICSVCSQWRESFLMFWSLWKQCCASDLLFWNIYTFCVKRKAALSWKKNNF